MEVAVTGHTAGIGLELFNYFKNSGYQCLGFSRSNGFDITNAIDRSRIANMSKLCDVFVNNAYSNFDDSQYQMLQEITNLYQNQNKIIINISSRATVFNYDSSSLTLYKETKKKMDLFCENKLKNPWIINLKPGLTDTPRVQQFTGNKMSTDTIALVVDSILKNQHLYKVSSITFGL